ncbi:LamG domain-containing protein [Sphingobium herbicidovorans]|uniref:LamG domain-containing protein n=1 Tax=Sphingobium herbicidovorans TaxID=76947 RepID=UPI000565499A|nr:LamG domain-containing protein [Sphingobium herbicidovorans]
MVTDDPYAYNNSLMMTFSGSNGSTSFTDASRWAHGSITANGNAQIQSNKLELDGTGDFVLVPRNTGDSFDFTPTSEFTCEVFGLEIDSTSTRQFICGFDNHQSINGARDWRLIYDGTTGELMVEVVPSGLNAGTVYQAKVSWTPAAATAYDIAWSWDGANIRLYVDGVFKAKVANTLRSSVPSTVQNFRIGSQRYLGTDNEFLDGRIAAIRLTRGKARMTSETVYTRHALPLATSGTTSDPYFQYTRLVLYGEGADGNQSFRDHSASDRPLTAQGAVENDTGVDVNGTPSIKLGSNADYIRGDYDPSLLLAGLDFCMEAFVKCTDSANWNILLGRRNTSNNFYFGINAGKFRWDFFNGSSAVGTVTGATTLSTNTVYHLCAIRTISDNKLYLFVDGALDGSAIYSGARTENSEHLGIGHDWGGSTRYFRGAANWARITIGHSRYSTSGFTPPSVPYLLA